MIKQSRYQTVSEAFTGIYSDLINNPTWPEGSLDGPNYRHWTRDHIITIEEPRSELDMSIVSFNAGRWRRFLTEYFQTVEFRKFLLLIKERRLNDAQEYSYICHDDARHSLGNCLFGLSIRTGHTPRVTLISRSCNFIPTGVLDISLGAAVAEYVAEVCNVAFCPLIWYINHLQLNSWPSMVYYLNLGLDPKNLDTRNRMQKRMLDAYNWTREGHNPNQKYQFYFRYMGKIAKAARGIYVPTHFIPHIPADFLPNAYPQSPLWEYEESEDPSPYNPTGSRPDAEERMEALIHENPLVAIGLRDI